MPTWDIPGEFSDYRLTVTPKVKTPIWASYDTRDEGLSAPQHHQDAGGVYRHHGGRGAADADGAEGQRLDAEPKRSQPGRTGGFAAARRRWSQEYSEGRDLPGVGQPVALSAGAGDVLHPRAALVRGHPIRRAGTGQFRLYAGAARPLRPSRAHAHGGGRPADWISLRAGDQLDGGVRHSARRLVVQQQVSSLRRAPGRRADGVL